MIVFDLKCLDSGEVFEGWFRCGADYEEQSSRGLVQCPFCQSANIEKAPMAPRVPKRRDRSEQSNAALAELRETQAQLLRDSEWVGDRFPDTARKMHAGELDSRPVHGQASAGDARSLLEEGIPVLPLPLPVVPPDQVN